MRKLIYYPSFDVKSKNWLKFALLYLDEIRPIIPKTGDLFRGSTMQSIIHNTELIKPYRPEDNYEIVQIASNNAMDLFEKILERPGNYIQGYRRNSLLRENVFLSDFTDKSNQNYLLFNEKLSNSFAEYCIERNLAHRNENDFGLYTSKKVSHIYMSFLADEISNKSGLSSVTDHRFYNRIILNKTKEEHLKKKLKIVERTISLIIPEKLENIDINEIIKLRSDSKFNDLRKIYAKEITEYLEKNEQNENNYILNHAEIFDSHNEYIRFALAFLGVAGSVAVALESFTGLVPAIPTAVFSMQKLNDSRKKIRRNRQVEKYFTSLKSLQPHSNL